MPKLRKVKRKKTYKVNINRKRLRDKLRKLPAIECRDIKDAWEAKKSTRRNLSDMGLAYDANKALKIPNFKRDVLLDSKLEMCQESGTGFHEDVKPDITKPAKIRVAETLEAEAKAPRVRNFRLPDQQVRFVTYMMDKYGDDYKAMSRDKKNYYQMTWRQIRAKINSFKGVPEQYAEYLLNKGEIVLSEDAETLAETRKRIAQENVAKYCAPKPKKANKTSQWLEESVDDFDTADRLEDIVHDASEDRTKGSEKKLRLFSDDDESDNESERKKSKLKKSQNELDHVTNSKSKKNLAATGKGKVANGTSERTKKYLEKLPSSESDDDEEFEGDTNEDAKFVDLEDYSDEELSSDDALDNGEFVTDSDEESD